MLVRGAMHQLQVTAEEAITCHANQSCSTSLMASLPTHNLYAPLNTSKDNKPIDKDSRVSGADAITAMISIRKASPNQDKKGHAGIGKLAVVW